MALGRCCCCWRCTRVPRAEGAACVGAHLARAPAPRAPPRRREGPSERRSIDRHRPPPHAAGASMRRSARSGAGRRKHQEGTRHATDSHSTLR
jgi:hypothetical protein